MAITRDFDIQRHKLRSPFLRLLFDYWNKLREDRAAPDISDVDALYIPAAALPYVILIDVEYEPSRVRYRLVGTHGVEAAGWDYTGKYADELDMPNTMAQEVQENFTYAIQNRPMFANYDWPLRDGRGIVNVELIQLPLLRHNKVTRCFCAEHVGQDQNLFSEDITPIGKSTRVRLDGHL